MGAGLIPAYAGSTQLHGCQRPPTRAHPRLRGEHVSSTKYVRFSGGSSPLTRGARLATARFPVVQGLIAAYAGSTSPRISNNIVFPAHPRLRGEHFSSHSSAYTGWGSSPLTRGALRPPTRCHQHRRLIPAYAGSTGRFRRRVCRLGAHPRLRGEHAVLPMVKPPPVGSSPLTRGALWCGGLFSLPLRLIPAYAGSTVNHVLLTVLRWAHPRLRGEHAEIKRGATIAQGSSPLTRGAPGHDRALVRVSGLIPAYAGSTSRPAGQSQRAQAHPRLRGEHNYTVDGRRDAEGSSPLTRGARRGLPRIASRFRLIPAYAGSTRRSRCRRRLLTAHPRLRGEHIAPIVDVMMTGGSSPLTRGAPSVCHLVGAGGGLIPAYAGSTGVALAVNAADGAHPRLRGEHTC
ncbi:hypothetical protein CORTU0001_0580 [Corynebacterium tuberculostearicum SK141]|nr:hypothetical protein CORTU0001_0580 [Corynebacterium tuberculostearicum SK141]